MISLDFNIKYSQAATQLIRAGICSAEHIPSLDDMKDAILQGQECEQISSPYFEAFFDWWDYYTAIEQIESGFSAEDQKPILLVAYEALIASGELCSAWH
ncbi:hypothetical protein [Pseudomonas sp. XWY-1]|uniref:hypothetical protein n=1 Tax=Pseudomonas sp. XWY-1 TaxID=2069256 RepID=UPI000CF3F148|nr:hypothetical protein [Pseudomonas sp. XWY-1]